MSEERSGRTHLHNAIVHNGASSHPRCPVPGATPDAINGYAMVHRDPDPPALAGLFGITADLAETNSDSAAGAALRDTPAAFARAGSSRCGWPVRGVPRIVSSLSSRHRGLAGARIPAAWRIRRRAQ